MLYLVHSSDGYHDGEVDQSNKVYDYENYDRELNKRELKYISVRLPSPIDPDKIWVGRAGMQFKQRLPGRNRKPEIVANGQDECAIEGLPMPCLVTVLHDGLPVFRNQRVDDGGVAFCVPFPGTYEVTVMAWPFRSRTFVITAAPP
jgi:hypothetical protein